LDREQQEILAELETKRAEYGPLKVKADRAVGAQMRVYDQIKELERRLAEIHEAREILR